MLQLLRGKEGNEGFVNDRVKASDERSGLVLDLSVHLEVCHVVNIADPTCDDMYNTCGYMYDIRTYLFSLVTGMPHPPGINSRVTTYIII